LKIVAGAFGDQDLLYTILVKGNDTVTETAFGAASSLRFSLDGGGGNDTITSGDLSALGPQVDYMNATKAVKVDLTAGSATGGGGHDTLVGIDGVQGSMFNDVITGNAHGNFLFGDLGNDKLDGKGGADMLDGGAGKDTMIGGNGQDVFHFNKLTDSGKTSSTRDKITDFKHGTDDIDLSNIDANTKVATDQQFTFIGTAHFHKVAGELHYLKQNLAGTANDKTIVEGDVNGDGKVDFQIELAGLKTLTIDDFIL
jgi:serralysin